jgi:RNA polymerase sigma-70 factor (ECF subfamily)
MLRQPDDVEEIGQDIFLQAYRRLGHFDPERGVPFSAWLIRIARNRCLNHLKKQQHDLRHRETIDQNTLIDPNPPDEELHRKELAQALQVALAKLTPEFRETFVLVAINGMPVATAAGIQGVAIGTIKSRLARARQALNKVMEEHHAR